MDDYEAIKMRLKIGQKALEMLKDAANLAIEIDSMEAVDYICKAVTALAEDILPPADFQEVMEAVKQREGVDFLRKDSGIVEQIKEKKASLIKEFDYYLRRMSGYNAADSGWGNHAGERRACRAKLKSLAAQLREMGLDPNAIAQSDTFLVDFSDYS